METGKERISELDGQIKKNRGKQKKNWKCEGEMEHQQLFKRENNKRRKSEGILANNYLNKGELKRLVV